MATVVTTSEMEEYISTCEGRWHSCNSCNLICLILRQHEDSEAGEDREEFYWCCCLAWTRRYLGSGAEEDITQGVQLSSWTVQKCGGGGIPAGGRG